ncbi:MAG: dUTP diphosphatase [Candidatus Eremiobacter antarcticus]|nr:dUTP diphosphatase [Candidatus Eremiobacteraeota bacterium]MBC5808403.1 dUTP diphosphatase [Candidatus Eremiobacteraeota bacterium]PZR63851.1 MAG: dUTP diphosphatase [Candidatus Eremiobacter sp. RRmetagenome_bin22]
MSEVHRLTVEIQPLPEGDGLALPSYMTDGAAGCDLRAAVSESDPLTLQPGQRALVPAGFCMALPQGFEAQIRPRSGLAVEHGIGCLNAPGTIDSDYRGPVCVLLINLGREPFVIRRGDRIAQMIISRVERVEFRRTQTLDATARGGGGFGSTGKL